MKTKVRKNTSQASGNGGVRGVTMPSRDDVIPGTRKIPSRALDDDVDALINSYRESGHARILVQYEPPKFTTSKSLSRSLERIRDAEQQVNESVISHRETEREMLDKFGYGSTPFLMRPVEMVRRRVMSARDPDSKLEMIAQIGGEYVDSLRVMHDKLAGALKHYGAAHVQVEEHLVHLEDLMIDLSSRKDEIEADLDSIKKVRAAYEADAPHDGSYAEKILWKRGLRAIEKDERSLKSLNLRVTRDLNQAIEFQRTTSEIAETVDISYTMNSMALSASSFLSEGLALNIDLYMTNAKTSDQTLAIYETLDRASQYSNLMTRATHERMSAVGSMIKRFTMPGGDGARSISGGGMLNGLREYLSEMQDVHDSLVDESARDMLP